VNGFCCRGRGWSLYGVPWSQPVATGRKSPRRESRVIRRKPLRSVATGCRAQRMVRRGSTVRVRQRVLQKPRTQGLFVSPKLAHSPAWGRYGALWSLQVEKCLRKAARTATLQIAMELQPRPPQGRSRVSRSPSSASRALLVAANLGLAASGRVTPSEPPVARTCFTTMDPRALARKGRARLRPVA
jgi:hypothetical protein